MAKLLILNGSNLNLLGTREPVIYDSTTLQDLDRRCQTWANPRGHELLCFQSNAEHELMNRIHAARNGFAGEGCYHHSDFSSVAIQVLSGLGAHVVDWLFRQRTVIDRIARGKAVHGYSKD